MAQIQGTSESNENVCLVSSMPSGGTMEAAESAAEFARRVCSISILTSGIQQPEDTGNPHDKVSDEDNSFYESVWNSDKIPITCRSNHAILHKIKLGSGKKGKCINFESEWYTPSEFENISGLEMSKDWKRSLRYGGKSLMNLIEKGIVRPHASTCMCATCTGNGTILGPVIYATKQVRKRKAPSSISRETSNNNIRQSAEVVIDKHPALQSQNPVYDLEKDYVVTDNHFSQMPSAGSSQRSMTQQLLHAISEVEKEDLRVWDRLQKKTDAILEKVTKLQETISKTREECNERRNNLLKEILYVLKQQNGGDAYVSAAKSMRYDKPIEDQEDDEATEICGACGRAATSECTGCRKATYCSTKCQEKDWNAGHKDICQELSRQESNHSHESIVNLENPDISH